MHSDMFPFNQFNIINLKELFEYLAGCDTCMTGDKI